MISSTSPFFTIIIPVFNRAHLLRETIASVLAQTVADFELIVVDDGSSDDPGTVCRSVADPRIRFVRQDNGGASSARNRGMDEARGDYVAFLDSDDRYLPGHLESLKSVLVSFPRCAVYSQIIADRGPGKKFVKPPRAIRPDEDMASYLMCDRGFVQTSGLCLPTDIARRVRYRTDAVYGDDTDFAIRLHLSGCAFIMTPHPTVLWSDDLDHSRLSDLRRPLTELSWLEDLRGKIPDRAYYAYRGWHLAKSLSQTRPFYALGLFLKAVFMRAYSPRLAGVILMQIMLPNRLYRRVTDRWLVVRRARTKTHEAA